MNFVWFLACLAGGFICIKYSKWITDNTQRIELVEKYLGPTGTYTFWKIAGVAAIAFGFYKLFN